MTNSDDANWIDALTYLAAQDDAPAEARKAAKDTLALHDRATVLLTRALEARAEQRSLLEKAERDQIPNLLNELRTSKRVNVAGSCDHLDALRELVKRC